MARKQTHPASGQEISQMSVWVREVQAQRKVFRATLQDRQVSKAFNEDPGWGDLDAFSPASRMLGQEG
jgi:hypothetical protein